MSRTRPNGEALDPGIRKRLTAELQALGEAAVVAKYKIGRATLARLLAGMSVNRGTLAQIELTLLKGDADTGKP